MGRMYDGPSPMGRMQDGPSPMGRMQDGPSPMDRMHDGPSPMGRMQDGPSPMTRGTSQGAFRTCYIHLFTRFLLAPSLACSCCILGYRCSGAL